MSAGAFCSMMLALFDWVRAEVADLTRDCYLPLCPHRFSTQSDVLAKMTFKYFIELFY